MRQQTSEESVGFMKRAVLASAAAIWSAVVPMTWASPPSDAKSCETFEEARQRVVANMSDDAVAEYEKKNAGQLEALLRVLAEYPESHGGEWILRVSDEGLVDCIIVPRSTAFSKPVEDARRATKLTKPHRAPLYLRCFSNRFTFSSGVSLARTGQSKDGQGSSEGFSEWGPEQEGVRTSLVAREKELSLGKPILLRLEMENVGSRVIHYDPTQVAINSSISIEGNDGVKVPSIAGNAQTGGGSRPLNPGERVVLFETLDVADQYLLTSPGSYTVRFRGKGRGFADTAIPPSNAITIRVADGAVRPSRQVARSLFDAGLPPGWRVLVSEEGSVVPLGRSSETGTALALMREGRSLADSHVVLVWVTASFSPLESPKQDGARETAEPIGRCPWGEVYLWSVTATAEELSALRTLITSALSIEAAE